MQLYEIANRKNFFPRPLGELIF